MNFWLPTTNPRGVHQSPGSGNPTKGAKRSGGNLPSGRRKRPFTTNQQLPTTNQQPTTTNHQPLTTNHSR
ncbi:MAG: hypothetical protein ACHBN1_27500 [Heteroscytonema crispum UTEX LB 1556]